MTPDELNVRFRELTDRLESAVAASQVLLERSRQLLVLSGRRLGGR